jgi:hypothetical protein
VANVQKQNNFINVPSLQTFRSYIHNQYVPGVYPERRKFGRVKIQLAKTSSHRTLLTKCIVHDIFPKGLTLKVPYHSYHSCKITLRASKAPAKGEDLVLPFQKGHIECLS